MAVATKEQILKVLKAFNPWWILERSTLILQRPTAGLPVLKRLGSVDETIEISQTGKGTAFCPLPC